MLTLFVCNEWRPGTAVIMASLHSGQRKGSKREWALPNLHICGLIAMVVSHSACL